MSRLVIDMTGEQHQKIKIRAAVQGITIKDYVIGKIFQDELDEEEQAWQQLMDLLKTRIENTEKRGTTPRTIEEITEIALKSIGKQ